MYGQPLRPPLLSDSVHPCKPVLSFSHDLCNSPTRHLPIRSHFRSVSSVLTSGKVFLPTPLRLHPRRPQQRLHHHAILFCLFSQSTQLFRRCLGRDNIKIKTNALKADGHVFGDAKRAAKIQVSLHRDLNAFGGYAHGRGHHLAGDLRAGRQSPSKRSPEQAPVPAPPTPLWASAW